MNEIIYTEEHATHIGYSTLLGFLYKEYPFKQGNCFSLMVKKRGYYVLNMNCENLEYLIKCKIVDFPIKINCFSNYCIVVDERIPNEYMFNNECGGCCDERIRNLVFLR
jgi:hypothetical protein